MKTVEKLLDFCNEITIFDHYNIERVLEIENAFDCVISV